ncbi:hypothetical protein BS47DRAFT_1352152 [Hydnum rufescens UP504]|uniref:Peroxisomal dehydratase n=1 Tax=Hydnum rufescens UP504 TaxID=1448309 RepID=A0A9P6ALK2_9AGAM|nr:hypothetical protein BS47DRAFT_1352152 [Hydnum rufescens UP504]
MSQKYDLAQAVGFDKGTLPVAWTNRDLLLYAIGIGATRHDLNLVYELQKDFTPFPTFPVVLAFKGSEPDVVDFNKSMSSPVPGLPSFDPSRILHGSQELEILRPIPAVSGKGWTLRKKVVGVHENKTGVVVDTEDVLVGPDGLPYTRMLSATFHVGAKANGTKFDKAIVAPMKLSKPVPNGRAPDHVIRDVIGDSQAIIYRLSGDYNPLHIDPAIGKRAGFGGIIFHGLGSYGFVARGILHSVAGGNPLALKAISCRFSSPVKASDTLETSVWEIGPGPDGTVEFAFVTKNLTTGLVSLSNGIVYVKRGLKSKL